MYDLSRCFPEHVSEIGAIRTAFWGTAFKGEKLIRINFDLILPTMAHQVHDLSFREAIIQTIKIIRDNKLKDIICERLGAGYYDDILRAANRVWSCENVDRRSLDECNNSERDAALEH